jgi:predicted Zn-dependent protease with MMP-like domain
VDPVVRLDRHDEPVGLRGGIGWRDTRDRAREVEGGNVHGGYHTPAMPKRRRGSRHALPLPRATHDPFERLVERALAGIPSPFRESLVEVAIVIEDEPTPGQLRENGLRPQDTLYGLYEGVPRTEWAADWATSPNKISLFRLPLEEDFPDPADLEDEVRITVIHELAHHLGIDDDRLDELGVD